MQLAVREFLVKHLGADENGWPTRVGLFNKWLLIKEEFEELSAAVGLEVPTIEASEASIERLLVSSQDYPSDAIDEVETVDAICDLLYVIMNLCEELHLNIQPFFDEVHRSNMTKTPAVLSPNKKIMKGPDWQPPAIKLLLEQYRGVQHTKLAHVTHEGTVQAALADQEG